jgi:hypothetical protein
MKRARDIVDNTIRFQHLLDSQNPNALQFAEQCEYELDNSKIYIQEIESIFELWGKWCLQNNLPNKDE